MLYHGNITNVSDVSGAWKRITTRQISIPQRKTVKHEPNESGVVLVDSKMFCKNVLSLKSNYSFLQE